MASLKDKAARAPLKILYMADTGGGKTGALASLAKAGYELFMLDYDFGTDILAQVLEKDLDKIKVHIESLRDKLTMVPGGEKDGGPKWCALAPSAYLNTLKLLSNWTDTQSKESFGDITTWDRSRILVLDSFSMFGTYALNYTQFQNGRAAKKPYESDWGEAQNLMERFMATLFSDEIRCHVIFNTHVLWKETEEGVIMKGLPMSLGKALSPKLGRYVNTMLYGKTVGQRRMIFTKPNGIVEAKCPILDAADSYPVETGLAEIFKLWETPPK